MAHLLALVLVLAPLPALAQEKAKGVQPIQVVELKRTDLLSKYDPTYIGVKDIETQIAQTRAAIELEQRRVMHRGLVEFARVLRDQFSDHFQMTEFLDGDVLKHVSNSGILDMKRLHPILQRRRQFARGAAKLL